MPIIRKNPTAPSAPTPNTEEASSPPSRFQQLRGMLATGTRLAGGFVSNAGGPIGALTGGASELIAEGLEGSLFNQSIPTTLARVGVEAGIGAVPLGKTLSTGRALLSAAKGAGFNAAGDVMRQASEQYDPKTRLANVDIDWNRTGLAGLLGGAVSGTLGHLSPKFEAKPAGSPRPQVLANDGTVLHRANNTSVTPRTPRQPLPTNTGGQAVDAVTGVENPTRIPYGGEGSIGEGAVNRTGQSASSMKAEQQELTGGQRLQKNRDAYEKEIRRSFDEASQEDRLREVKRMLGIAEPEPKYRETLKGYSAEGVPASATFNYVDEAAEEAAAGARTARRAGRNGVPIDDETEEIITRGMAAPPGSQQRLFAEWYNSGKTFDEAEKLAAKGIAPAAESRVNEILEAAPDIPRTPAIPAVAAPASPLAKLLGAADEEVPTPGIIDDLVDNPGGSAPLVDRVHPEDAVTAGPWVDEAIAELEGRGIPPPAAAPRSRGASPEQVASKLADAEAIYPEEAFTELQRLSKLYNSAEKGPGKRELGKQLSELKRFMEGGSPKAGDVAEAASTGSKASKKILDPTSESGMGQVEALMSAALGIGGGLVGAAQDDENPLRGAAVGLVGGAAIPQLPRLLSKVGMPETALATPEGVRETAKRIYEGLPNYQRAAYLMDARGISANVWAGPYGSMMTGAIEAWLSGDPRGKKLLLDAWNPANFLKEWKNSANEARDLLRSGDLGRTEGVDINFNLPSGIGGVRDNLKTALALPALGMTMGDAAARRFITRAGFSMDEARRMTLTNEPDAGTMAKTITDFGKSRDKSGKGSALANILLPFKRTPANIMQEGAQRTPGLGVLKELFTGDGNQSGRELAVQQGLGLVAGTAGYQAGQEMDDPRSTTQNVARRTISNLAGRYSLPATLGMIAGQTIGSDKKLNYRKLSQAIDQSIPLPTPAQFGDSANYVAGKIGLTGNPDPKLPRGLIPFQHAFVDQEDAPILSNYSRIRRRSP